MRASPSSESASTREGVTLTLDPVSASKLIFPLEGIDLGQRLASRKDIERWNPHRNVMAQLDAVVWVSPDFKRGIALRHIRDDEFWVSGHFPGKPMFPGIFMIEAAAQLACYIFLTRRARPGVAAFLRIENAVFRNMVVPGDDLYVLCKEVKHHRRRFISDVQGIAGGKIAFEATLSGIDTEPDMGD